tara:strand:+ start:64734 stop:65768 length:1035 start_codon:yes stop_codon:yes gene_type:complete
MRCKLFNSSSDLLYIREEWNKIFMSGFYTVFQSFEYCYYSSLSSNIYVLVLFDDDNKIIEIWPLEIIENRLHFINDKHADFCDILTLDNTQNYVLDFLKKNRNIFKFSLKNVKSNSFIRLKLKKVNLLSYILPIEYSEITLNQTLKFPKNFTHLVYRQKRRLKRIISKYDSQLCIYSIEKYIFPLEDILRLRKSMILRNVRENRFFDNKLLDLVKDLYDSGKLRISILTINGKTVAMSLFFYFDNTYYFWIDLFDDLPMINIHHNTIFIKHITSNKKASFNFGRGIYNYKTQNFRPEIKNMYEFYSFRNYYEFYIFKFKRKLIKIISKLVFHSVKKKYLKNIWR